MPFGNNLENTLLKGYSTLNNPMVSQPIPSNGQGEYMEKHMENQLI